MMHIVLPSVQLQNSSRILLADLRPSVLTHLMRFKPCPDLVIVFVWITDAPHQLIFAATPQGVGERRVTSDSSSRNPEILVPILLHPQLAFIVMWLEMPHPMIYPSKREWEAFSTMTKDNLKLWMSVEQS